MTALAAVRSKLEHIAGLGEVRTEDASLLAAQALAVLNRYIEQQRRSYPRLLVAVDESCITRCHDMGGGAWSMRARLGTIVADIIYIGDESSKTDATIEKEARAAVLDSLRIEVVRQRIAESSDHDLLDALNAAERGDEDDVGDLLVEAHNRGLRP